MTRKLYKFKVFQGKRDPTTSIQDTNTLCSLDIKQFLSRAPDTTELLTVPLKLPRSGTTHVSPHRPFLNLSCFGRVSLKPS